MEKIRNQVGKRSRSVSLLFLLLMITAIISPAFSQAIRSDEIVLYKKNISTNFELSFSMNKSYNKTRIDSLFTPMVWAYTVYTNKKVYAGYTLAIQGGVITNSNNTYKVEVGIKDMNGFVVEKKVLMETVDSPGTHLFLVSFDAPQRTGKYKPYMNITWAKADNSYADNYAEGEPFNVVSLMFLSIYVDISVIKWGKDSPGLIYPGDTILNVSVLGWLTDSSLADMKYDEWLAKHKGQKVRLPTPLKIKMRKLIGTTTFNETGSKLLNVSELEFGDFLIYSEAMVAPFSRYLVVTLSVTGLGDNNVIQTDDGEISVTYNGYKFELPPHMIIKGVEINSSSIVRPGDNLSVTLHVWTNLLPGEGSDAMFLLGFKMRDQSSLEGIAHAKAPELHEGDQIVSGVISLPSDYPYNFTCGQQEKNLTAILTIAGVPDVWSGDNYAKINITLINPEQCTPSTFPEILIPVAVLLVILIAFLAFILKRRKRRYPIELYEAV